MFSNVDVANFLRERKYTFFDSDNVVEFQKLISKKYNLNPIKEYTDISFFEYAIKCPAIVYVNEKKEIVILRGTYVKPAFGTKASENAFLNICNSAVEIGNRLETTDLESCLNTVLFLMDLEPKKSNPDFCVDLTDDSEFLPNFSQYPPVGVKREEFILVRLADENKIGTTGETYKSIEYWLFPNDSSNSAGLVSFLGNSKFLTKPADKITVAGLSTLFYAGVMLDGIEAPELSPTHSNQLFNNFRPREEPFFSHPVVKDRKERDKPLLSSKTSEIVILPTEGKYPTINISEFLNEGIFSRNFVSENYYVVFDLKTDTLEKIKINYANFRPDQKKIFVKLINPIYDHTLRLEIEDALQEDFGVEFSVYN